jgi:alpha-beta hydrolase superfamily lysophospholipase
MATLHRRGVLAAAAGLLAGGAAPAPASVIPLKTASGRAVDVTVWTPAEVRGVVLFGTGHGSWPDRYAALASRLVAAGFAVLAPLHVDSVRHPERARYGFQASFMERLADMAAVSAHARATWPGRPVAAAGHSFGSLIALCLGGALARMAPLRDPAVRGVAGFSTPGRIPGLVGPDAYAALAVPTLIVTGDADVVPGFVTDWRDHLFPVESAPAGDKAALVVAGAGHDLVGGQPAAAFARAAGHAADFLQAHVLNDRAARARLQAAPDADGERWIRR